MNTSALSRLTTFATLTSNGWSAPAWNTASCPAPVCGARRMHSFALFLLAHMILSAEKNLLLVARLSSSPARGPSSSGISSGVSAHSNRSHDCQLSGAAGVSEAFRSAYEQLSRTGSRDREKQINVTLSWHGDS